MSRRIHSGGLLTKDPDSDEPFFMDWGREDRIGDDIVISDSVWVITGPDADLDDHDPGIGTLDADDLWSSSPTGQVTKVHLTGGTLKGAYTLTNTITTTETPPRIIDASFTVLVEQE